MKEKNNTFGEIKTRKDEYFNNINHAKAEASRKINELNVSIDAANKMMEAAAESGDFETFFKAKKALEEARTTKEMVQARLEKAKSPISKDEYLSLVKSIREELDNYKRETARIIIPLIDQMETAGKDLEKKANEAQDLLHFAQHTLYKDMDRYKAADGNCYGSDDQKVKHDVWDIVYLAKMIKNHSAYGILSDQGLV